MKYNNDIIEKLVFIKYMYNKALELSYKPYPESQMSLLIYHDAIELFLDLVCQNIGINKNIQNFHQYWDEIDNSENILSHKREMKKLNKARVGLKHSGIRIHDSQIEEFRINSKNFFEVNTESFFGLNFNHLSLVDLITFETVKSKIKVSYELLNEKKFDEAKINVAKAFEDLLEIYESESKNIFGKSTFDFGPSMAFKSGSRLFGREFRDLANYVDSVNEYVENFGKIIKILLLGIDYNEYMKFDYNTPYIRKNLSGDYIINQKRHFVDGEWVEIIHTKEEIEFGINFVIKTSIIIQEKISEIKLFKD